VRHEHPLCAAGEPAVPPPVPAELVLVVVPEASPELDDTVTPEELLELAGDPPLPPPPEPPAPAELELAAPPAPLLDELELPPSGTAMHVPAVQVPPGHAVPSGAVGFEHVPEVVSHVPAT
jgi:hypothetical protein